MRSLVLLLRADSAEGILILIAVALGITIMIVSIKWLIASFKAFKAIEETRKDVNFIYNHLKERDREKV